LREKDVAMLSSDLAELYRVTAKALMQAVKRNAARFPADFMFQLNAVEWRILKSQIVTSSWGGGGNAGDGERSPFPAGAGPARGAGAQRAAGAGVVRIAP
jgi:hypothetical protein